jgi:hypothetical protein
MGQDKQARKEFQKVYAEAPSYEDVAAKLERVMHFTEHRQ